MLLPYDRLVEACQLLGFRQREDDPHVFDDGQGNILFFCPSEDGEVEEQFVIEDIAAWNPELADSLATVLDKLKTKP